ncbi:hypothetical protein HL670_03404 [Serratia plymuthica]|nr:hypothetical protein HL670_03404 [Serratia plymuthica]
MRLHVPANARQAVVWPVPLENHAACRSVSDDDLRAWCTHLCYRPGEVSLCRLSLTDGIWSSHYDENGYAHHRLTLHTPYGNTDHHDEYNPIPISDGTAVTHATYHPARVSLAGTASKATGCFFHLRKCRSRLAAPAYGKAGARSLYGALLRQSTPSADP